MMVMPSNNSSMHLGWLAGKYEGLDLLGWLLSPAGWRTPHRWMKYACDNDRFGAAVEGKPWDEVAYERMLVNVATMIRMGRPPLWLLVPDVPFNREGTLFEWERWAPRLKTYGVPLAFAVQDGMTQRDVPADAKVIFVGGSTEWKWGTVLQWCKDNARVHVGRVNSYRLLWSAKDAGAESCDGTGWFRGRAEQLAELELFLHEMKHGGRPQIRLGLS